MRGRTWMSTQAKAVVLFLRRPPVAPPLFFFSPPFLGAERCGYPAGSAHRKLAHSSKEYDPYPCVDEQLRRYYGFWLSRSNDGGDSGGSGKGIWSTFRLLWQSCGAALRSWWSRLGNELVSVTAWTSTTQASRWSTYSAATDLDGASFRRFTRYRSCPADRRGSRLSSGRLRVAVE